MRKSKLPIYAGIITIIVFFFIGYITKSAVLKFKVSVSHTEIAFLPIVLGLLVWFISARVMKWNAGG
ncbi:hypothetical protein FIU87_13410 [Bacillus sp. THAF10]|uniref:ATPase n=1 Tax=Bacillus sp. THAF10 TaxID=2587848 RepID=UPI0012697807|nr:ATPase [Bacillus sp. THAF10]QFT89653.1 hypothetical protein FIU87_13410 [Bacillus sp. THAF10]